jgi:urease accessory protein
MSRRASPESNLALLRLCQLVSPALPVGAYAYSQGLEYAVEAGWVHDEPSTLAWLRGVSRHAQGTLDLPVLLRMHCAWLAADSAGVESWTAHLLAARGTAEARAEERHLGQALARILCTLDIDSAAQWSRRDAAYATLFSLAAARWQITSADMLCGYLWSWSENQVLAAIKLVPLGQSAGQRLLHALAGAIPAIVSDAATITDAAIGVGVLGPTMASVLHETQYTRLFRS